MSTELAILDANQMQAAVDYADRLACSALIPDVYQGKPANILWAIEYGRTLGLSTMAAINGVNVIKGKPTASAALISALVRRAGHKMRVGYDGTSMTGWAEIVRIDDPEFTFRSEWNLDRAVEAELCKVKDGKPFAVDSKGNTLPWKKFYPSMVKARAITEVARDACEEVLFGLHYTPEELGAEVDEDGSVVTVQQAPASAVREPQPHRPRGAQRSRLSAPAEDEWTQPPPAQPIDDAEIVEDGPDQYWETAEGKQKLKRLHTLIAVKSGPKTDDERHVGFSRFCGREITSAKQMTAEEVDRLIAALDKASDYTAPSKPSEAERDAAANAEAEKLAATDPDSDSVRIESDLRDRIEAAGEPLELDPVLADVWARQQGGQLSLEQVAALEAAADVKAKQLEQQRSGWSAGISRQMDAAA